MATIEARYEYKYLITEDRADWIREVVRSVCEPDAHGDDGCYAVHSMYLDTVDWRLARQTVDGVRHRFKLRVRTYGFEPTDPVFLENKMRVGTSITKERALIARDLVEPLLRGELPVGGFPAALASHQADLDAFRNRMDALDIRPRLWVSYRREAWASAHGDGARLTFDRLLQVQPADPEHPYVPDPSAWTRVPLHGAPPTARGQAPPLILEMKFNGASPRWMQHVVHGLRIERTSVSKYARGVEHVGDVPWTCVDGGVAWTA